MGDNKNCETCKSDTFSCDKCDDFSEWTGAADDLTKANELLERAVNVMIDMEDVLNDVDGHLDQDTAERNLTDLLADIENRRKGLVNSVYSKLKDALNLNGRMRGALNNCCHDCNLYKEPYCTKDMHNRCIVPKLIVEADKLKKEG